MVQLFFVIQLGLVLALSVSVVPLIRTEVAPPLLAVIVIATAVQGQYAQSFRWAIWGGLSLDLLSPPPFGLTWLAIMIVALLAHEIRQLIDVRELPWLWPVWFAVGSLVVLAPLSVRFHEPAAWLAPTLATVGWGTGWLLLTDWFVRLRRRGA